ncbi:MAG TPA: FAD-containing oxidoreductase [Planctomycetaceae bacterium]|nr:FAD-containing oxidoreductase [Planctomycetaceae bacterium]
MTLPLHPALLPDDEFNRRLAANVHPAEWQNPVPRSRYNLLVVGAGPAGLITSIAAAGLGARVALVERDLMGGDCLNVGCVPSKSLLRAASAAEAIRSAHRFGIHPSGSVEIDFGGVMQHVRQSRAVLSRHDAAARYRDLGVDVYFGTGEFVDRDAFEIGGSRLTFSRGVICTGARARIPPIPGLATAGYLTNETVFSLTQRPGHLAVLGGGPIGCELSQSFVRLGSRVSLIDTGSRLLPRDDEAAVSLVQARMRADGVELRLQTRVTRVEATATGKRLFLESPDGDQSPLEVDEILIATGRVPNIENLGLDRAGVQADPQTGIGVNDFLATSNRRIFAAGDVCSAWRFTHAADAMARLVVRNALFHGRQRASRLLIPWCTYTDPELAHVGLTAAEAAARRVSIKTFEINLAELDRGVVDGVTGGLVRIHVLPDGDRIAGATVVGPHAGDLISPLALAMTNGLGLSAISKTIFPYPTMAEALKRGADASNRTRLTPLVKSLMQRWFQWTR